MRKYRSEQILRWLDIKNGYRFGGWLRKIAKKNALMWYVNRKKDLEEWYGD